MRRPILWKEVKGACWQADPLSFIQCVTSRAMGQRIPGAAHVLLLLLSTHTPRAPVLVIACFVDGIMLAAFMPPEP